VEDEIRYVTLFHQHAVILEVMSEAAGVQRAASSLSGGGYPASLPPSLPHRRQCIRHMSYDRIPEIICGKKDRESFVVLKERIYIL
jgi:hypothetical protein